MESIKKLLLMLSAIVLLASCGSDFIGLNGDNIFNSSGGGSSQPGGNNNGVNNGGNISNEIIIPSDLSGTIWTGIYFGQYIGLKIKNNSELLFDQCSIEQKVIEYVKTEKGSNNFFTIFNLKKEGEKYIITGVKSGKPNTRNFTELYIENKKLILKDKNGQIVVRANLIETPNDEADKKYIFDEINKLRASKGKDLLLDMNDGAKEAARIRATEIEKKFEHIRPDGRDLNTIIDEIAAWKIVKPQKIGEIIGDNATAQGVMENWKKSEGHSKTMLDDFQFASVGKNGRFWVVFFVKIY